MKHFIILTTLILLSSNVLYSQTDNKTLYTQDELIPSYYLISDSILSTLSVKEKSHGNFIIRKLLGLNENYSLSLTETINDAYGGFHESYKVLYKDIEIDGVKCNIHYAKDGTPKLINGNVKTIDNISTKITSKICITKEDIWNAIKKIVYRTGYVILSEEDYNCVSIGNEKNSIYVKDGKSYFVYKYRIESSIPELNLYVYVDAHNGDVVDVVTRTCSISSTTNTLYSGLQNIETAYESGLYRLRDYIRGDGIITVSSANLDYTSTNVAWSDMSTYDRAAIDVHWGAEKTYDYYMCKFGRNSFDNQGGEIKSYVNYNFNNACWDGVSMLFGITLDSLTYGAIDVVAHELTHGVTQFTSNLTYSGESGAINEGLSDVFGISVKNEYKYNYGNIWKLGSDCVAGGIRDISNPECAYYKGQSWIETNGGYDNGGVHTNSGVFNYWFYLLAHGGSGTNEEGVYFSISPIGLDKAIQICYLTNTAFLTSSSRYIDARFCTIYAAQFLNYNTDEINQISNAWDAVGVYDNIVGNNIVYNTGTYRMSEIPNTCSVIWTLSGSNSNYFMVENNTPSLNECRITKINCDHFTGSSNLTLTATVMLNSVVIKTVSKQLIAPGISGPTVPCGSTVYFVWPRPSDTTIEWTASGTGMVSETDSLPHLNPNLDAFILNNYSNRHIMGTISAILKVGNDVVGTIERKIDTSDNLSGLWYQVATSTDTVNSNAMPFENLASLFFVPNRKVFLSSEDFIGANITFTCTRVAINDWSNNNGVISFTPEIVGNPYGLGWVSIEGIYANSCKRFKITLYVRPLLDGPLTLQALNHNGSDNFVFVLNKNNALAKYSDATLDEQIKWQLIIIGETGRLVYESSVVGQIKEVNTSAWKKGVYIAMAKLGDRSCYLKLSKSN